MWKNIGKSVIGCHDRLVDIEPESHSQWLDLGLDVESCIEVGIAGVSAVGTMEESPISDSDFSAETTTLGCVFGADIDNRTPVLQGFVFDKILQLPECPRMECPVKSSTFVGTDVPEVFQGYDISCSQTAYNFFAYPMVLAPHKTCPSARQFLEMSLGRFCSFVLQGSDNFLMPEHLRHDATIEPFIGRNGKMFYSDIDAENTPMLSRAQVDIDIFGKAQAEKYAVSFVNPNEAFVDFPIGIFGSVRRKRNIEFLATSDCADAQYTMLIRETSWGIESHGASGDGWFGLSFLDHSTRLLDAGTGKLGWQTDSTQVTINKRMEFDIVPDSVFPSGINTILEPSLVNVDSLDNFVVVWKFEIDCGSTQHIKQVVGLRLNRPQFLLSTSREVSLRPIL